MASARSLAPGKDGMAGMRTVARPELRLDAGALADEDGESGVVGLDVPVVLLHELPGGAAGRGRLAEEEADLFHAPGQARPPRHRRRRLCFSALLGSFSLSAVSS